MAEKGIVQSRFIVDYSALDVLELVSLYGMLTRAAERSYMCSVRQDYDKYERDHHAALWSDAQSNSWDVLDHIASYAKLHTGNGKYAYASSYLTEVTITEYPGLFRN